jgi:hypothetical protein
MFRAMMVAATVVAGFAVLEVPAALRYVHWYLIFERIFYGKEFASGFDADPVFGWRRRPNLRWDEPAISDLEGEWSLPPERAGSLRFTYDARGFRNPTTLERADVVLVGDSYVEGAYNDDDEVIARRLETRLGRPVANLGIAGYGTRQERLVIEHVAPKLSPKVIVWFFFEGNDIYEDQAFLNFLNMSESDARAVKESEGIAVYHDWRLRSFVHNALPRIRRWLDPVFPTRAPYFGLLRSPGGGDEKVLFTDYAVTRWTEFEAGLWNKAVDTFRDGIRSVRERGIQLLLVYVPIKFRVYQPFVTLPADSLLRSWREWPLRDYFNSFCTIEDIPCIDLTGTFQQALAAGGRPYARTDSHWSAEGHDIAARAVETEIRTRNWLD